jgi:predicted RNase H-like HicB family nuclease
MIPTLQSLWLVEAVEYDEGTGKVTLVGLFNRIDVSNDAGAVGGGSNFFSVRGVHGRVRLTLLYVDLSDDAALLDRRERAGERDPDPPRRQLRVGAVLRVRVTRDGPDRGHDDGVRAPMAGTTRKATRRFAAAADGGWVEHRGDAYRHQVYLAARDGIFHASAATVPGVAATGDTEDEAVTRLRDALAELYRAKRATGEPMPRVALAPPSGAISRWVIVRLVS